MNKKIIITETDFRKLVSRILNEQDEETYTQMVDKIAASTTFITPVNKASQFINWGYNTRNNATVTFPWRYDISFGFEGGDTFFVIELSVSKSDTAISTELRKFLSAYPNMVSEILGGGNRFMMTYNGFKINQLKEVIDFSQKILRICAKYTSGRMQ